MIMRKPCCDSRCIRKGNWSEQEDDKLIDYIRTNGESSWHFLHLAAGLKRCRKSFRLKWMIHLRTDLKLANFGEDEEDLIIRLHFLLGDRWSLIAGRLPGRTENEVENHWNSHLREKLIKKGVIDSNNRHLHGNSPCRLYTGATKSGTATATSSENHKNLAGI